MADTADTEIDAYSIQRLAEALYLDKSSISSEVYYALRDLLKEAGFVEDYKWRINSNDGRFYSPASRQG